MTGILWAVVQEPIALQPRYEAGKPHHVTLQYGVEREQWEHLIGLPMSAGVIAECWNDRIQALSVVLPNWVQCQSPNPHISVSWVIDAHPVESNAMLAGDHQAASVNFDYVQCVIEFQEWGEKPIDPRSWRDRPKTLCPTCLNQGTETWTRSLSKHCRKHRN